MKLAITLAAFLLATNAYAKPGATDAYKAISDYRDDASLLLDQMMLGAGAVACGIRDQDWGGKLVNGIVAKLDRMDAAYREPVTNKELYDYALPDVKKELMQTYDRRAAEAVSTGVSKGGCIKLRTRTALLKDLDGLANQHP